MGPRPRAGRDIPLLARRLEISQEDEIAQMERWLEERGEEAMGAHGDELMPGMLTAEQLAAQESADGRRSNRLFLQACCATTRVRSPMVDELRLVPGAGVEPAIDAFARHVYPTR